MSDPSAHSPSPGAMETVTTESLWKALDLPAPEVTASQHQSKRVVLLGRPLSGKRTLCRRLCLAAEAQYPSGRGNDDGSGGRRPSGAPTRGNNDPTAMRRALYRPSAEDGDAGIVDDLIDVPDEWDAQPLTAPNLGRRGTGNHLKDLPHGAGVVHDYVVQRIPVRGDSGFSRGGVTRRTVEFFCCDTPGALSAALPTLQSLEEALVLVVVDVSQPGSIREQLDRSFDTLQSHITSILQTYLPTQDEVKRLRMMEQQQQFWLSEEQRLLPLRAKLSAKDGETFIGAPGLKMDEVNKTVLRIPLTTICAVRSMIVCTKTDVLDKASKMYDTSIGQASDEELPYEVDLIVPPTLRSDLRRHRMALLPFVSQLIRQYAVLRRSSLVAVSSRISTTATDSAGEAALVHPFYRGVWSYLSSLFEDNSGATDGGAKLLDAPHLCTANLFPTSFLPAGLDTLAVLQHAVASQSTTLPLPPVPEGDSGNPLAGTGHLAASGPLDSAFKLHQHYLQQIAHNTLSDHSFSPSVARATTAAAAAQNVDDSAWTL